MKETSRNILTPTVTTSYTNTLKNTMTSNANNEETKKLLLEIRKIRQEIKSSTLGHLKENIPASTLNSYIKLPNNRNESFIQYQQNAYSRSSYAVG